VRAYTVATTAVALGVSSKWVDNALSHHQVRGVYQARQGIARRVTPAALLILDVAVNLVRALALPLPRALETAQRLIDAGGGKVTLTGALSIEISADLRALTRDLDARLERAVEISPTPRRGRPRRK
jgi:hypothetical protein